MRVKVAMFIVGASLSSVAFAQTNGQTSDAGVYSAAPAASGDDEGYSFTGLRAEFLGGFSRQLPDVKTAGPVLTTSRALRHSGGSAGVQGGYDIELGPVVAGVFGGYALLTSQGCGQLTGTNQGCLRPQGEAEAGARIGLQLRGRFLAYGKGSYVNTRIETRNRNGTGSVGSHINKDGYRVGGGVEFALTRTAYVKAEYDYTRTERFNAAPYGFQNTSVSYHDHAVLGGFGIRF